MSVKQTFMFMFFLCISKTSHGTAVEVEYIKRNPDNKDECLDPSTNKTHKIGETWYPEGRCMWKSCEEVEPWEKMGKNDLRLHSSGCGDSSYNWYDDECTNPTHIEGDKSLKYPDCCPKWECPNDGKKECKPPCKGGSKCIRVKGNVWECMCGWRQEYNGKGCVDPPKKDGCKPPCKGGSKCVREHVGSAGECMCGWPQIYNGKGCVDVDPPKKEIKKDDPLRFKKDCETNEEVKKVCKATCGLCPGGKGDNNGKDDKVESGKTNGKDAEGGKKEPSSLTEWTHWSGWGKCIEGFRKRTRKCVNPETKKEEKGKCKTKLSNLRMQLTDTELYTLATSQKQKCTGEDNEKENKTAGNPKDSAKKVTSKKKKGSDYIAAGSGK